MALDGVDLHVRAGEVVALVGKNGAGLVVAAAGAGLLPAGNLIEFYGVLLQDRPNSYGAYGLGQEPWIGRRLDHLLAGRADPFIGGVLAAVGMARTGMRPRWLVAFAPCWPQECWPAISSRSGRPCSAWLR